MFSWFELLLILKPFLKFNFILHITDSLYYLQYEI